LEESIVLSLNGLKNIFAEILLNLFLVKIRITIRNFQLFPNFAGFRIITQKPQTLQLGCVKLGQLLRKGGEQGWPRHPKRLWIRASGMATLMAEENENMGLAIP
jgi:hypothetical protein